MLSCFQVTTRFNNLKQALTALCKLKFEIRASLLFEETFAIAMDPIRQERVAGLVRQLIHVLQEILAELGESSLQQLSIVLQHLFNSQNNDRFRCHRIRFHQDSQKTTMTTKHTSKSGHVALVLHVKNPKQATNQILRSVRAPCN